MLANKNLLNKLLINLLDGRLKRLEKRNTDEMKNLEYTQTQFKNLNSFLNQISKKEKEKNNKYSKRTSFDDILYNKSKIKKNKNSLNESKVKLYQKYSKQNSNLKNSKTPSKIISKYSLTAENWTKKRNSKYNYIKSKYMDGINKINKSKVQTNEENRKLFLTPEPRIIKKKKIKDKLNISRFNLNKIDKQSGRNINNIKTQKNLKKERMVSDIDLGKDEIKFVLKELQKKKEKKPNDSEEEESENEDKNSNNENQSFNKNSNSSTEKNKEKAYKVANKEIIVNFGNYINSSDGNKIVASIAFFLDRKTKYNFFSCSKQLINNLILELNNIYNHVLSMNKIKSIDLIEEEINNINNKFKDEDFDSPKFSFKLSKGSLKALEILNDENYDKIFKIEELSPPLDEIILIYRIFFQLINKEEFTEIISDKKFWKEAKNYFLENSNGKIGSFINEQISEFDFTKENIYKLKNLSNGKEDKLKPKIYENICKTTGLFTFVIKEAFEYCGIIFNEKKLMPSVLISYLEYIKENLNECKEYVNFLGTLK